MKKQEIVSKHNHSQYEETGDCKHLLSSLCDYVDGELSPELCTALEKHMRECPRCRVVVDTVKKTVELYQETAADTQMPDEVRERLYLRLNLDDYLSK